VPSTRSMVHESSHAGIHLVLWNLRGPRPLFSDQIIASPLGRVKDVVLGEREL